MRFVQISPQDLQQRLSGADAPQVLDVREPHEYAHCHLDGSLNIPMRVVPVRLNELDQQRDLVVLCHHGMRSAQVANYLTSQGFSRVFNLKGGIDAWSVQVDASVPRY